MSAKIRRGLGVAGALAFGLVLVASYVLLSDWTFWNRYLNFPEDAGEWPASFYQPALEVGSLDGDLLQVAAPEESTIPENALEEAARWAKSRNSTALLVIHNGKIALERYWQGTDENTLVSGRAMSRTPIPLLVGIGLEEGWLSSLDDPASDYMPEWANDKRGAITLRQLLHNVSGLENPDFSEWPYNKAMQLSIGSDFASIALGFDLVAEPGTQFSISNVNAQILGVILERASGKPYEDLFNSKLWAPLGGGRAVFFMDREDGMPAVYCCFRTSARDWARLGMLLLQGGQANESQIVPPGWVEQMQEPSNVYKNYGLHVWVGSPDEKVREYVPGSGIGIPHSEPFLADDIFFAEGGGFRTLYIVPSERLVVLRLGYVTEVWDDWDAAALPNIIIEGLRSGNS